MGTLLPFCLGLSQFSGERVNLGLKLVDGWIALAIVIFGLWVPARVALGAYLIVGLRSIAIDLQDNDVIDLPSQIVNMLPWFLMIITLLVMSLVAGIIGLIVGVFSGGNPTVLVAAVFIGVAIGLRASRFHVAATFTGARPAGRT